MVRDGVRLPEARTRACQKARASSPRGRITISELGDVSSLFGHHWRGRRRAGREAKAQAQFNRLHRLLDVDGADRNACVSVDKRHAMAAEIVEVIFEPHRPEIGECPFQAGAYGPGETRFRAFEVERSADKIAGKNSGCTIPFVCPRKTGFAV